MSDTQDKTQVLARVQKYLDETMKPYFTRDEPWHPEYPYISDLSAEWHKNTLYFYAHRTNPTVAEDDPQRHSKVDYTRMAQRGKQNSFSLAYKRHTGKYFLIYDGLTLDKCLELLMQDELLFP